MAVLSVRCEGAVKHFIINQSDRGDFYIERLKAKTIEELIQSHLWVISELGQEASCRKIT